MIIYIIFIKISVKGCITLCFIMIFSRYFSSKAYKTGIPDPGMLIL